LGVAPFGRQIILCPLFLWMLGATDLKYVQTFIIITNLDKSFGYAVSLLASFVDVADHLVVSILYHLLRIFMD
jgi:hypothetical protein